jgi:probable HAF family extracellular repeat protein
VASVQFTRVVHVLTATSLVTLAAACSSGTPGVAGRAAGTAVGTGTGAPAATGTSAVVPPTPAAAQASATTPQEVRPRVQAGRAPVAAGVDIRARTLRTERPGGRVTGLSADGVAVGVEGRSGTAPDDAAAERAVRWDADGRATPLPALAPGGGEPRIGPGGLIALTTAHPGDNPAGLRRRVLATTAQTADGARPGDAAVAGAIDVGTDSVLVARRTPVGVRRAAQDAARDDGKGVRDGRDAARDAPTALWSPRTGRVTPVPVAGRFLTPDGTVVGDVVTRENPGGTPATWRDGRTTELEVPRGWKGEPHAGAGDTVVGRLTKAGASGDGGQDAAAAVAWRKGELEYLPPLGGRQSVAAAVNGRGTVVGTSRTPDPDGRRHAVLWRDGRVTDLGTLDGEGESWAVDVSDDDVAVGWSSTRGGDRRAVAWVRGGIVDLGAAVDPAAASQADGVVGRRVYGRVSDRSGADSPVIWTIDNRD